MQRQSLSAAESSARRLIVKPAMVEAVERHCKRNDDIAARLIGDGGPLFGPIVDSVLQGLIRHAHLGKAHGPVHHFVEEGALLPVGACHFLRRCRCGRDEAEDIGNRQLALGRIKHQQRIPQRLTWRILPERFAAAKKWGFFHFNDKGKSKDLAD
jgi:hypothetical protein